MAPPTEQGDKPQVRRVPIVPRKPFRWILLTVADLSGGPPAPQTPRASGTRGPLRVIWCGSGVKGGERYRTGPDGSGG